MTIPAAGDNPKVFVYVIGHDGSSVVKIGKADDVAGRLAGIQRMSPVKLRELARFAGGYELETALHRRFKHLRTHGEWFDFGVADPVAEVAQAVAEAEPRLAEERARRERRDAIREEHRGLAAAVVGDRTLVYLGEASRFPESARCTARLKSGKRCGRGIEGSQRTQQNVYWRVPGHGLLECDSFGATDTERTRWLAQRCESHAAPDWPAYCAPEWVPFDPVKHAELLCADYPIAPGLATA